MLADDSLSLRKKIFHVMEELRGDGTSSIPGDHVQEQLRILKDRAREMEGRVQGFVRAINQILDDEEDMALMNLSRLITNPERFIQPVSQDVLNEESDEPELILEVYLQQALSEVNALVLLKGNITNTEELVSLQMDTIRNRLLYINTVVSAVSLSVTVASLVGSLFGMNLKNHMEDDPNLFVEVVSGTLVGVVVMLVSILVLISRTGVMPANPRNVLYSKRRIDVDVAQSNSSTAQNSGG
jgi:magnesium transporter